MEKMTIKRTNTQKIKDSSSMPLKKVKKEKYIKNKKKNKYKLTYSHNYNITLNLTNYHDQNHNSNQNGISKIYSHHRIKSNEK